MAPFFLSAILSGFLLAAVIFANPVSQWLWKRFEALWSRASLVRGSEYSIALALILLVTVPFVLLLAVVGAFHPRYSAVAEMSDIFLGSTFRQVILGAIFSVVFCIWIARAYKLKPEEKFPWALMIELGVLGFLFLAAGGNVLLPFIDRLTSIKGPGIEIGLSSLPSSGAPRNQRLTGLPSTSTASQTPLAGLDMLSAIDSIMSRDNEFIRYEGAAARDGIPRTVIDDVQKVVGGLAKCHKAIYENSGELEFTRQEFARLQHKLRAYALAANALAAPSRTMEQETVFDNIVHELAETTVKAASNVARRAFAEDLIVGLASGEKGNVAAPLFEGCWAAAALPCTLGAHGSVPGPDYLAYCNVFCDYGPIVAVEAALGGQLCEKIRSLSFPAASQLFQDTTPDPSATDTFVKSDCKNFLFCARPEEITLMADAIKKFTIVDSHFGKRPYIEIVYASTAELSQDHLAALQALQKWRIEHASDNQPDHKWYDFRALSTLLFFTDEWLASKSGISTNERNFVLTNYAEVIRLMESIGIFEEGLQKEKVDDAENFDQALMSVPARKGLSCIDSDDPDTSTRETNALRAANSRLRFGLRFLDQSLDDPNYVDDYSVEVEKQMKLMVLDLSCLKDINHAPGPNPKTPAWMLEAALDQAEIRRLEAKRLFLGARAVRYVLEPAQYHAKINQARTMLDIAHRLLAPYGNDIDSFQNADQGQTVMDQIAPSEIVETLHQIRELSGQLDDAEQP